MSNRFGVTYKIFASSLAEAQARAEGIALEQTVEIPRDVVPPGYIEDVILGQVINTVSTGEGIFESEVTYSPDSVGYEMPQLLNVMFGNSSIQKGLKVIGFTPGIEIQKRFPGPRFGAKGVRALTGRNAGGFVCPVINPQGSTSEHLAELCYLCARAGADIIKEDHGLANQHLATFKQRVPLLSKAISRANTERADKGNKTRALYFPNLGGHGDQINDFAMYAKDAGADGVLIIPGLYGFDAINRLARNPEFGLPIMAHPSHLGPYVLSHDTGYSHAMMFGTLMRLAGADISIFPNVGGRFGFSVEECTAIANACTERKGYGKPILPSPGGGMSIDRMGEMREMYGDNAVYLLGGGLLRFGENIGDAIKEMRKALD